MNARGTATIADVEVVAKGNVPQDAREHAERMVTAVARYSHEPILHARVKLTRAGDPALPNPVITQVNLDVNGRPLCTRVAAVSLAEGINLTEDLLRRRLARLARHWEARRGAMPSVEPHEWRHSSEPTHRPRYFPRPIEERQVVRHKAYEMARTTPDEAILDLDLMDYEFQLFTDLDTDQDSVVYRAGETGYRMAQLRPDPRRGWTTAAPMTVSDRPAPALSLAGATDQLNATGLPFLFYADDETGQGRALYLRYDGHYGLITPAG